MFASNSDIQSWLGEDKIEVTDGLSRKAKVDADRLIRGQLAGVFTLVTLSSWATPDDTPELIRGISGRLSAAFIYRELYSEETTTIPQYAQELYNEAIQMLLDIKTGNLVVIGVDESTEVPSSAGMLSFWPTAPVFTMDQTFS